MNAADRPKGGLWPVSIDGNGLSGSLGNAVFPLPVGLKLPAGFLQPKSADAAPWSDPAAAPLADVQAAAEAVGHPGLAGPRAPRVPRADWELPGHPVYELARRVFMIDNSNAKDPAKEWEKGPAGYRDYAFNIAQGLIRVGYGKLPS